jgi:beta-amylase
LDTISEGGYLKDKDKINNWAKELKNGNIDGIMIDVWWGIVQRSGPYIYDFSGYRDLFNIMKNHNLKIIPIMSFHQCLKKKKKIKIKLKN